MNTVSENVKVGDEMIYRQMFIDMDHAQLVETALALLADTIRLREELDEKSGIIR